MFINATYHMFESFVVSSEGVTTMSTKAKSVTVDLKARRYEKYVLPNVYTRRSNGIRPTGYRK